MHLHCLVCDRVAPKFCHVKVVGEETGSRGTSLPALAVVSLFTLSRCWDSCKVMSVVGRVNFAESHVVVEPDLSLQLSHKKVKKDKLLRLQHYYFHTFFPQTCVFFLYIYLHPLQGTIESLLYRALPTSTLAQVHRELELVPASPCCHLVLTLHLFCISGMGCLHLLSCISRPAVPLL
ncbi:unnamed protein product, partial [Choristocarpus tenellus]